MTADVKITRMWSEIFLDGSSLTWDSEANAGYLNINPNPDAFGVAKTVHVGSGVNVDLDKKGRVRGIESLGHSICVQDLLLVVRWMNRGKRK